MMPVYKKEKKDLDSTRKITENEYLEFLCRKKKV